ncbi:MAG TPA: arginase family protein [Candidatus Nitrosotalea sp.]|nr:arginase family protein [Candidatus Nitrosotalea sp.]
MRICWANTEDFEDSDVVVFGIPDESKSHALRKGSSEAPHKIREISNIRDTYKRGKTVSRGLPLDGISCKVYDYGNITRDDIGNTVDRIVSGSKIPIAMGGDHSISTEIIKSIHRKYGMISLIYFDAHPDFITSAGSYYGSVLSDILPCIDVKSSVQIGIRTPEQEEIDNIKRFGIPVVTPLEILKNGVAATEKAILDRLGKNVYISIDMDAIDPAFAPGVSVPVPLGLQSLEVLYLLKSVSSRGIVGLDMMEVCPNYDIKDRTAHLASRMIGETISSLRKSSS